MVKETYNGTATLYTKNAVYNVLNTISEIHMHALHTQKQLVYNIRLGCEYAF